MIPLSKLIRVKPMWAMIGAESSPIGQELYDYVVSHGDEAESGQLPDVTPEMVTNLRNVCWEMLTRISVEMNVFRAVRRQDDISGESIRASIVDAIECAIAILRQLGVEPTRPIVLEYINTIDERWQKQYPHPPVIAVCINLINKNSEIIDAMISGS